MLQNALPEMRSAASRMLWQKLPLFTSEPVFTPAYQVHNAVKCKISRGSGTRASATQSMLTFAQ